MAFINKMDIVGADFFNTIEMIEDRLKANPVPPVQLPIGKEDHFIGVVDLVNMNARIYNDDLGENIEVVDIPEELKDLADEYRENLLESVAEYDEELMIKYLEGGEEILPEDIIRAIRTATINVKSLPYYVAHLIKTREYNHY